MKDYKMHCYKIETDVITKETTTHEMSIILEAKGTMLSFSTNEVVIHGSRVTKKYVYGLTDCCEVYERGSFIDGIVTSFSFYSVVDSLDDALEYAQNKADYFRAKNVRIAKEMVERGNELLQKYGLDTNEKT
jgi:hypothetical protein